MGSGRRNRRLVKKLVEIAEQLCRLFLGDEMAASLNPESPRSWRLALKIGLKPWISWSAEAQDGHRQGWISATIDNILWEGLIPTISSADSISTGIGGSVNRAVSCVDRSLILQHISEEPFLLEARATLQELLRQSFHLMEREPPKIRMVILSPNVPTSGRRASFRYSDDGCMTSSMTSFCTWSAWLAAMLNATIAPMSCPTTSTFSYPS